MPVVLAVLVYLRRLMRRPIDRRLKQRQGGPLLLVTAGAVVVLLWLRDKPGPVPDLYLLGELCGVTAVYLMSCSLVLATRARPLEPWFGGLDRMYLWHKQGAIVATCLVIPHVLLTGRTGARTAVPTSTERTGAALGLLSLLAILGLVAISLPRAGQILRIPYERWLFLHRLIGLYVLVAVIHGLLLDDVVAGSGLLRAVYLAFSTGGLAAYAYSELIMRRRAPRADYVLTDVTRPSDQILDLRLTPTGPGVSLRPGQFVFLRIGGNDAWREHPFTVAGRNPDDGRLRVTIRSLGSDTARMHARLAPGLPATVTGPYGMFDYTLGREHQVWIAGGIGIAPFLSWLEALDPDDPYRIDLYYSTATEAEAVYLPELRAAEQRLGSQLRVHPVFTRTDGHLTADRIADTVDLSTPPHVFLCGPAPMVEDLTHDLQQRGVPKDHLHAEHFSFR